MPKISIIAPGTTSGVDMRQNPLFLGNKRAAFALNLTFKDGSIRTRPGFIYHSLGRSGPFQGAAYVTPSMGLSAVSYTAHRAALMLVADGKVSLHTIGADGFAEPQILGGGTFTGNTFVFGAESYVIFLNEGGATCWWNGGNLLTTSPGIQKESEENTHDTFDKAKNWLPWHASTGTYIHGRTHISVDFAKDKCSPKLNSELWVSDILTKRGPSECNDILIMEEACLDSFGGALVAPSRLGKTLALEVLPAGDANGEGMLVDFREFGVVTHDTLSGPRESIFDPESGKLMQQGWDEKRVSTVKLQTVSAVGRYAVCQLPDDLWFRSDFGFHFLKKTLGLGTLTDEHTNHESRDIQPLIDADEDGPLHGAAVGHWLKGSRFLGTVGFLEDPTHTSSSMGRGMVVLNQESGDAEKPVWEGLWLPDPGIAGIHQFSRAGQTPRDRKYGALVSSTNEGLYFCEFCHCGNCLDVRDEKEIPVRWRLVSGAFLMHGSGSTDEIRGGILEFLADKTTSFVKVSLRTDTMLSWVEWITISQKTKEEHIISRALGPPPKGYREATWFQFMLEGEGFVDLRFFDVEAVKIKEKADGRNSVVPVTSGAENFYAVSS